MKKILLLIPLFIAFTSLAQTASTIHKDALVIDAHNDVLSNQMDSGVDLGKMQSTGQFDLVRAKQGGLDAQIFSIWCGEDYGKGRAFALANRQIDSLYSLIGRYPDQIRLARNTTEIKKAVADGKLAALIGVEGGHMIEERLDYIDSLASRGMCYLTLTWNHSTEWATSAYDETFRTDRLTHKGLNDHGKKVIKRLNKLGVMVDVSHVGEKTFYDVLAVSKKPVIASHSSVYALNPHQRNLKDKQLLALAKNNGVAFVNFYSGFLDSTYNQAVPVRPPLATLIKHIDYMVKLIGIDHVGLGADFEGAESYPLGLDDVKDYPKVTQELVNLGYSRKEIGKLLGGNLMRVLKANTGK